MPFLVWTWPGTVSLPVCAAMCAVTKVLVHASTYVLYSLSSNHSIVSKPVLHIGCEYVTEMQRKEGYGCLHQSKVNLQFKGRNTISLYSNLVLVQDPDVFYTGFLVDHPVAKE